MTDNMNSRKYAIYGGTFDPVHVGHIALADHAVRECGLDILIFMPDYVSPFKQDKKVTDGTHRCGMIEAVLKHNPAFRLSRYEVSKEGPSYTVETLRHWKSLLGGELHFVLGFDSVVQLDKWYLGEEILRDYPLITSRRPDTDYAEGMAKIEEYRSKYGSDITVLEMEPVDASSTRIRNNIKEGLPVTGMVLPEVERYIIEHDLYR
ncbi:MAG: nicotinate (nicotinamide) nucleotide adenylyltransferase [Mogibacterium sp.]|nr:nicotinate (nicotinamide) nucleotide adenylyltransferase [Mogibacterium sp.]